MRMLTSWPLLTTRSSPVPTSSRHRNRPANFLVLALAQAVVISMCVYGSQSPCGSHCGHMQDERTYAQIECLFMPMPALKLHAIEEDFELQPQKWVHENEETLALLGKQSASLDTLHHEIEAALSELKSELRRGEK